MAATRPPALRSRKDRAIRKVVGWLVALLYEHVEVYQPPGETAAGAELGVANHFGGFTDPILLTYAMDRVPRFIARDVIWRYPIAKQVLDWVGAIPVHKREDTGPGASNDAMFRSTYQALGDGALVVIFPEGITVDDPAMARLKTGAARIALGAAANGVRGVEIVPTGIHYEDKAALRSTVFVNVGRAMSIDEWISQRTAGGGPVPDADDHGAVTDLTEAIDTRLRQTAPNFRDWQEAHALGMAAEVAIRNTSEEERAVDYGERERIAGMLARADDPPREAVIDAVGRYRADLHALGLSDRAVYAARSKPKGLLWRVLGTLLTGIFLLPYAAVGLLLNVIPLLVMWLVGRRKMAPAMAATVKPLAAVAVFGAAWAVHVWSAWRVGGIRWAAIDVLLLPVYLFALVAVVERAVRLWRVVRGWRRVRRSRPMLDEVLAHRAEVVETVAAAL